MQEKNNRSSNSLSICQKLFYFFVDNLLAHGVKRKKLGHHDSWSPAKPNGEMMMVHVHDHQNSKGDLGSQIEIHFKQFEGDQSQIMKADRIPDQVRSSRDQATEKGKKVSEQPPGRKKEVPLIQEKIDQPQLQGKSSSNLTTPARSRGPNKNCMVSVNESKALEERSKKKGKNILSDQYLTLTIQDGEEKKTPRRLRPLLSVAQNINEISDAFIKRKKEEMYKNLSMDTKSF